MADNFRATDKDPPARPEDVKGFRTVEDVAPVLWEDVLARGLAEAARSCGAVLVNDRAVRLTFMGGDYLVDFQNRSIQGPAGHRPPGFQVGLVLLGYLAHGQDLGLSGRMVPARDLNGGAMFFTGPHALLTRPVTDRFGSDPDGFLARAAALGLAAEEAGSGHGCRGLVLPHIAVGCVLHPEDDEFPAELTYTFDSYAHYHLALDGLWAMINVLADELGAGRTGNSDVRL
ncbi:DUF3786 domain-containing protein [Deltaproteobacteria bacterium OttesenSCG-928-M10]|nr:DUF3786 domain-containing protein [Deltaproteobacteria bacterium OttesenSCG-928-M10]